MSKDFHYSELLCFCLVIIMHNGFQCNELLCEINVNM